MEIRIRIHIRIALKINLTKKLVWRHGRAVIRMESSANKNCIGVYTVGGKKDVTILLCQMLIDFQNSFTDRLSIKFLAK